MKKAKGKETNRNYRTPISEVDGITVNGYPFVSERIVNSAYSRSIELLGEVEHLNDTVSYLENRELRHKCSLERQGKAIGILKRGLNGVNSHLDRIEGIMKVQDNAILYWNRKHDEVKRWFRVALGFSIALALGLASSLGYIFYTERAWPVNEATKPNCESFELRECPNARPMFWVNPNDRNAEVTGFAD